MQQARWAVPGRGRTEACDASVCYAVKSGTKRAKETGKREGGRSGDGAEDREARPRFGRNAGFSGQGADAGLHIS